MISLETHRTAESIRNSFYLSNFSPEIKALDRGGAEGLRNYYNMKNKRRKVGSWTFPTTKFKEIVN